jgi:CBS domain-containing protein
VSTEDSTHYPGDVHLPFPEDSLLIDEHASLYDAMVRLEKCPIGFTVFAVDKKERVTGVLTRGDVIRYLIQKRPPNTVELTNLTVRDAMTPLAKNEPKDELHPEMLYIDDDSSVAWYEQLTQIRKDNRRRWNRIKLLPVLDGESRLVNVLDLESPRTRARLEALVMATAFPFIDEQKITNKAMEERRLAFDSIHYRTQRKKVAGLCDLLLTKKGGHFPMVEAIFNNARADEILLSLQRSEEWLKGHVSDADMTADARDQLLDKVARARERLASRYFDTGIRTYFPEGTDSEVCRKPQLIVVLGCRSQSLLKERVSAAWELMKQMEPSSDPFLVLSGGGDGHVESEAKRMLKLLRDESDSHSGSKLTTNHSKELGSLTLKLKENNIEILLEEDSRDTLGNAVFSWFTLRLHRFPYGLRAEDAVQLERMVLITDGLHAPRSYDIFRRVFAFRTASTETFAPKIAVRTVDRGKSADDHQKSQEALRSESRVNAETFRLVNLLTNGYDVIENGHVRSILGQMLRLHEFYKGRWDLVRKYQECWNTPEA